MRPSATRRLPPIIQRGELLFRSFMANNCLQRAAALSFTTILSLVPLFAIAFAMLKGLGVPNKLAPLILEQVAAGSQELVARILTYINNTNMKSLGAIGLATLLVTVISLLGEVEEAFNAIWGVRETRSWARKFSDYLSVVLSGPLLLFAATSITTTLQSQTIVRNLLAHDYLGHVLLRIFHLVPYLSIWLALVFLYIFMPNTRVRFGSAVVGGLIAGTLWQVAQKALIGLQFSLAGYNAIYGTLAMLPVFMLWIYASWIIVLLGLEVVYAHQHRRVLLYGAMPRLSPRERSSLSLLLAVSVAGAFMNGDQAPTDETLADEAGISPLLVRELLEGLMEGGFIARTGKPQYAYLPARDPDHVSVSDLLRQCDRAGGTGGIPIPSPVADILTTHDEAVEQRLSGVSLAALVRRGESPTPPPGN